MTPAANDGNKPAGFGIEPRVALVVFVRILAVVFIVSGLRRWAIVLGPLAPDGDFLNLPMPLVVATIFFAVCDLVAAVGLWLLASWGTVVWLIAALTETVLHTVFQKMFPLDPKLIAFHLVSVVIYACLTIIYERTRDT
jgi:hypothetical protein